MYQENIFISLHFPEDAPIHTPTNEILKINDILGIKEI